MGIPIPTADLVVKNPWVWVWGGYGERNSVPTAALDSAVCMEIPMGMGMG